MKAPTPIQIYTKIKEGRFKYNEELHCTMILEILPIHGRLSAFLTKAVIGETTFYEWLHRYPIFKTCYGIAQTLAQEAWEQEAIDNEGNENWDSKRWLERGKRYFAKDKSKLILEVMENSTPWEQYSQILLQAKRGDFSASEIKQLMESINVGTRVYETFKLQEELDKMKSDLNEMSRRHVNNTLSVVKVEKAN